MRGYLPPAVADYGGDVIVPARQDFSMARLQQPLPAQNAAVAAPAIPGSLCDGFAQGNAEELDKLSRFCKVYSAKWTLVQVGRGGAVVSRCTLTVMHTLGPGTKACILLSLHRVKCDS